MSWSRYFYNEIRKLFLEIGKGDIWREIFERFQGLRQRLRCLCIQGIDENICTEITLMQQNASTGKPFNPLREFFYLQWLFVDWLSGRNRLI